MLLSKTTKILLLLLAMAATQLALAQASYKFSTVKIPHSETTDVFGVNDAGVMSGNYTDSSGVSHCFMRVGTAVTTITDPNGVGTSCYGINSFGAIVGGYALQAGFSNGFVYQNGIFTDIIVPGATAGTTAYGINDAGVVVGAFADNVGEHGFLFDRISYQTLDAPGAAVTLAVGINTSNLITLQSVNSSGFVSAWLLNAGNYTMLNVPNAVVTEVHAINNRDEIAFGWTDSNNVLHGAILANGQYYVADDPGGTNTSIDTINDHNEIVGHFQPTGATQAQGFKGLNTPSILGFTPPSGPVGTPVTITGTGFTQTTTVEFGNKSAAFTVNSDSQVTATVPARAKTGKIKIVTPAGSASSKSTFTVD